MLAQLLVLRLGAQLLLRDGQVAAERLDLQVGQLHGQLEVLPVGPRPCCEHLAGLRRAGRLGDRGRPAAGRRWRWSGRPRCGPAADPRPASPGPPAAAGRRQSPGWRVAAAFASASSGRCVAASPAWSDHRPPASYWPRAMVSLAARSLALCWASTSGGSALRTSSHSAIACVKLPRFSYSRARAAVDGGVLGVLLPGLLQGPDGQVEQAQGLGGLGHVHLACRCPRGCGRAPPRRAPAPSGSRGTLGGLELGLGGGGGQERQPAAAEVVLVLDLLGPAQRLAVDQVGRVELAAGQQQLDAVVEVAGAMTWLARSNCPAATRRCSGDGDGTIEGFASDMAES